MIDDLAQNNCALCSDGTYDVLSICVRQSAILEALPFRLATEQAHRGRREIEKTC